MNWTKPNTLSTAQTTLRDAVLCIGPGLHHTRRARLVVRPAPGGSGIRFLRRDFPSGRGLISARWYNVTGFELNTSLHNPYGATAAGVDPLLTALRVCGIDNALIEIDGPDLPLLETGPQGFVELFNATGIAIQNETRRAFWIRQPVVVREGEEIAMLLPDANARISVEFSARKRDTHATITSLRLWDSPGGPPREAPGHLPARDAIARLGGHTPASGAQLSLATLRIGAPPLGAPWQLAATPESRKLVDCLADLALAGAPVIGHYYGYNASRRLNRVLLRKLFNRVDGWAYLSLGDAGRLMTRSTSRRRGHTDAG